MKEVKEDDKEENVKEKKKEDKENVKEKKKEVKVKEVNEVGSFVGKENGGKGLQEE